MLMDEPETSATKNQTLIEADSCLFKIILVKCLTDEVVVESSTP